MRALAFALAFALGCGASGARTAPFIDGDGGATVQLCSQMHRAVSRWQGEKEEFSQCGPDVTDLRELTPIGNHLLMMRRPFTSPYEVWEVMPDGTIIPGLIPVAAVGTPEEAETSGFTFLPGTPPRVLIYDPRSDSWTLRESLAQPMANAPAFGSPSVGVWPSGYFMGPNGQQPWGRQFIGLEDGHLLDRAPGDGSTRIWRFVPSATTDGATEVELLPNLVGPPREAFRRGHRLVHLGPGQLLEWIPRFCDGTGLPSNACTGSDYNVWSYSLDPGTATHDPFAAGPLHSGYWPDVDARDDIVADESDLFVWTRQDGRIRSVALDPLATDPLGQEPAVFTDDALKSKDWDPPTTAPAIKHLVLILQNGRSFDAYFGQYCRGPLAPVGETLSCVTGPNCCEQMPSEISGAASCTPLDPATIDTYAPNPSPACMRAKLDGGQGFAMTSLADCGDARDFSCAAPDSLGIYTRLMSQGALADRCFQTYAFADAVSPQPDPVTQNLLYLESVRFAPFPATKLFDTPALTKELARVQVSWAIYGGTNNLRAITTLPGVMPIFYDPDWYPFRALQGGELESDIATAQLPAFSLVLPDFDDQAHSEAPGHSFDQALGYLDRLTASIAASPTYRADTLVLVTFLTAGGYYDHVQPPIPPPTRVDASSGDPAAGMVHYGPRVPLLALAPFALPNSVSHARLELSSVTLFAEWNWIHGDPLKSPTDKADRRLYRDTWVNNIGSLLDPKWGVPSGHD